MFEINLRRRQLDLDFDLQWSGLSTMQLCCTLSETVCFDPLTLASRIFDFIRKTHRRAHRKSRKRVVSVSHP